MNWRKKTMDKNEKAVILKGESIRRNCREFSLKDIKVTMVAAATIIVAAGGFTTYAIAKDAKEKAVLARIDNNNVESQPKFNADVLYEYEKMKEQNILGRRYFYPLISEFSTYRGLSSANPGNLPNAHKMANSVICLPMHHELSEQDVERILATILQ